MLSTLNTEAPDSRFVSQPHSRFDLRFSNCMKHVQPLHQSASVQTDRIYRVMFVHVLSSLIAGVSTGFQGRHGKCRNNSHVTISDHNFPKNKSALRSLVVYRHFSCIHLVPDRWTYWLNPLNLWKLSPKKGNEHVYFSLSGLLSSMRTSLLCQIYNALLSCTRTHCPLFSDTLEKLALPSLITQRTSFTRWLVGQFSTVYR